MSESYPWFKALHVAAAMLFVGGLLAEALMLAVAGVLSPAERRHAATLVRRWDRRTTTPAMLAVWALGLGLALWGGWLHSGWLPTKLVFVAILSGLHGIQSGALRRLAGTTMAPARSYGSAIVILCVLAIALLAVTKPF